MSSSFQVEAFVVALASPELEGRIPGTVGHEMAKRMIIEQFKQFGLQPLMAGSWEQRYRTRNGIECANLLAMKPARSETNRWILLGAHYDHCKTIEGETDLGANDNAASVGAVFETLRLLENQDLDCHIVLAMFDTEEPTYYRSSVEDRTNRTLEMGSFYFYYNVPQPLDVANLQCAIVLDLIGHEMMIKEREFSLMAIGVDSAGYLSAAVDAARDKCQLDLYSFGRGLEYSDHVIFDRKNCPFLFLSSGMAWHYHTVHDTIANGIVNFNKVREVSKCVEALVVAIGDAVRQEHAMDKLLEERFRAELYRFFGPELKSGVERLLGKHHGDLTYVLKIMNLTLLGVEEKITREQLLQRLPV